MFTFTINAGDDKYPDKTIEFNLDTTVIMYLCSILCSSDIIAAISIVKFDE